MLRSQFRENWFSIQHLHRKMNSWTMPSIPNDYQGSCYSSERKFMKRVLLRTLWKLAKEIQSNALSIITLALYCNHQTNLEIWFLKRVCFICSLGAPDQSAKRNFWKVYCSDLPFAITPGWGFAYFLVISKIYARAIVWRISKHENERKRNQIDKNTMSYISKRTRA